MSGGSELASRVMIRCDGSQLRYKESNDDLLLNEVVCSRSDHYEIHYQLTVVFM